MDKTYTTRHYWENDRSLACSVIKAVAAVKGVEPIAVEQLYRVVDPDALDSLFEPLAGEKRRIGAGCVRFTLDGCEVVVSSDGEVNIRPDESL